MSKGMEGWRHMQSRRAVANLMCLQWRVCRWGGEAKWLEWCGGPTVKGLALHSWETSWRHLNDFTLEMTWFHVLEKLTPAEEFISPVNQLWEIKYHSLNSSTNMTGKLRCQQCAYRKECVVHCLGSRAWPCAGVRTVLFPLVDQLGVQRPHSFLLTICRDSLREVLPWG